METKQTIDLSKQEPEVIQLTSEPQELVEQTKKVNKAVLKVVGVVLVITGSLVGANAAIQPLTLLSLENNFTSALNAYNQSMRTAEVAVETAQSAIQASKSNGDLLCSAHKILKETKKIAKQPIQDPLFNPCTQMRGHGVVVEAEPVATEVVGDLSKYKLTENLQQFKVAVTSYNPTVEQNDDSPCVGASTLNQCVLAEKGVKMLALSRDLREKFLPKNGEYFKYPMPVYVESDNPSIHGCYWVTDTLSSHKFKDTPKETPITMQIDLFFMNGKDNQGGTAQVSNKIENCSQEFLNSL